MSRWMRALEKVGLVESDPSRLDTLPATEPAAALATPLDSGPVDGFPPPVDASAPGAATPLPDARRFEDIYAEAGLAPGPFPAEKLLRILEGLSALTPEARKAAVVALDAADDAWSVDDALLDAEHKIGALDGAQRAIEHQARAALEQARAAIGQREKENQDAVARVRQQIADLQGLMEREIARAGEDKAALEQSARTAKETCLRESSRYDAEAARLRHLAEVFGATASKRPPAPATG